MKTELSPQTENDPRTWEEQSGLLAFLSRIQEEVSRFESTFGFGISNLVIPPQEIDGSISHISSVAFVLILTNEFLSRRTYCLYSVLSHRELSGHIGLYSNGRIETLKTLMPLREFGRGRAALYDWLRELVRASCDKR
ncbi:MAG TPA: hypothetical protein VEI46_02760 [Thermodesulfovibrionales bacterium]|nr:hypothetical protein [Thermodesulfovibrionales bacterium]